VFEVHLDGTLIFSKIAIGRFPETEEIISLVRKSMEKI
jgi:selT/selW/selH-like putative selenoprotein